MRSPPRCAWSCGARRGSRPTCTARAPCCSSTSRRPGDVAAGAPDAVGRRGAAAALAAEHRQARRGRGRAGRARRQTGDDAIGMLEEGGLLDQKDYTGRRISLDFKDVEIADVLRLIADVSDLNIIAGDEVEGEVTIRLVDVPWDQALDVILLTKGLGFVRVGNVLRIAPADVLKAEEEARLQERRAKEKLEDLVVKLQPVNYAQRQGGRQDGGEAAHAARHRRRRRAHQHADHQGHQLGDRRGDRAHQGDRHPDAAGADRGEDRRGQPRLLARDRQRVGRRLAAARRRVRRASGDRQDLGGNDVRLHDNPLLRTSPTRSTTCRCRTRSRAWRPAW